MNRSLGLLLLIRTAFRVRSLIMLMRLLVPDLLQVPFRLSVQRCTAASRYGQASIQRLSTGDLARAQNVTCRDLLKIYIYT